jgi:hypothetical protein
MRVKGDSKTFVRLMQLLFVVAAVVRLNNALRYPVGWGFDANENWEYMQGLLTSWSLPAPDAGWSTAHPPLFYYLAALISRLLGLPGKEVTFIVTRLVSSTVGLAGIWAGFTLTRQVDPDRPRRGLLCAVLLLFLPAHIYMSCMFGEEVLAAGLATFALVGVSRALRTDLASPGAVRWAALTGVVAGLALLTKLTGVIVLLAVALSYALQGLRTADVRSGLRLSAVALAAGLLIGGWYYARNLVVHGYLYGQGLPVHLEYIEEVSPPPGERFVSDFFYFPMSAFTNPTMTSPDLLRSVWGSAYTTLWADAHAHVLPRPSDGARRAQTAILVLALLPTAAFLLGVARGIRRWWSGATGADTPMLLCIFGSLAGFVLFAWSNPWYFAVKGSYLLSMWLPFSFYASEVLSEWMASKRWWGWLIGAVICVLIVAVVLTFMLDLVFENPGPIGLGPFVANGS